MLQVTKTIIFVEEIFKYFDSVIKGIYSDVAWYMVIEEAGPYLENKNSEFEMLLDTTLNIDDKALIIVKQNYLKRLKEVNKYL